MNRRDVPIQEVSVAMPEGDRGAVIRLLADGTIEVEPYGRGTTVVGSAYVPPEKEPYRPGEWVTISPFGGLASEEADE